VRIGIVIPAHNAAPWIAEAIASVLAQGFRDWTMVVVDDGSTDATAELVASAAGESEEASDLACAASSLRAEIGMPRPGGD